MNSSFVLQNQCVVRVPNAVDQNLIAELLRGYAYGVEFVIETSSSDCIVSFGVPTAVDRGNAEYVIHTTENGVYICGDGYAAAMRGFVTLLTQIERSKTDMTYCIPCGTTADTPKIVFRSVHLCIFHETSLDYLRKCVRACGMEKYSHVILEFWGMLRYDCMKELAWNMAFTKEQVRQIVKEANTFGMEVIPMFNHLGHASGCRAMNGKHVVLDQNPAYEYLYDFDGWVWDFELEDVRLLHKAIRQELIELCGAGHYFHLGCDEAYTLGNRTEKGEALCRYLNEIEAELEEQGRRGIIWGDMFLMKEDYQKEPWHYYCTGEEHVRKVLFEKLSRGFVIADWQYDSHAPVWPTTSEFTSAGFDVICCPWDDRENIASAIRTVTAGNLYGFMHTTWHTLFKGFPQMLTAGVSAWTGDAMPYPGEAARFHAAKVVRKVAFADGDYEKTGWSEKMMGPGLV